MSASVPASAGNDLLLYQASCFLGKSGQCVVLSQDTDPWAAVSIACGKGGRDTADSSFNLKSFLFEDLAVVGCRIFFLQRKFRMAPDMI